jgi:hypothetical protein
MKDKIDRIKKDMLENNDLLDYIEKNTPLRPRSNDDDLNKVIFLSILKGSEAPIIICDIFMYLFGFAADAEWVDKVIPDGTTKH